MKKLLNAIIAKVKGEPLVVTGVIVSAVIFIAGKLGIVLDQPTLQEVIAPIVVALIGRFKVTPTSKVAK